MVTVKKKIIVAETLKEFASTFFGDPILKMAVNAAADNAPEAELILCDECSKINGFSGPSRQLRDPAEIEAAFRLGQMSIRQAATEILEKMADERRGVIGMALSEAASQIEALEVV